MFYNQFLPGGTGGDIMKSYLLLKETPGKKSRRALACSFDPTWWTHRVVTLTGTLIALRYFVLAQIARNAPVPLGSSYACWRLYCLFVGDICHQWF